MGMTSGERTVYLAGGLFSARELAGNAALGRAIGEASGGRYRCVLPQELAQPVGDPQATRDQDIVAMLGCDVAVFQYDGLELDSGTVVEYVLAKVADLPAVLLRTDFRQAGDAPGGDPWNLMTSFFPRTERIVLNGIELYQETRGGEGALMRLVAEAVCGALDRVLGMPGALPGELAEGVYRWLGMLPGFKDGEGARGEVSRIFREKLEKGLIKSR